MTAVIAAVSDQLGSFDEKLGRLWATADMAPGTRVRTALEHVRAQAKFNFADLFAPLLNRESDTNSIYSVALALMESGQDKRAAQLFELFLSVQGEDQALLDFMADATPTLKAIRNQIAPQNQFNLANALRS